ncbi:phage portal protein [Curtobacterium sp. ISL-83]|uniref:phage portal protein n=1 Tax=Curtobacterium sp. ISL-83 TaxID=2819145 RepID=UPI001BE9D823|nr:phage portal protein [Curtobacterium sp. ISL-83]MBT2502987.1 phage portal protein [Curtobacterium sp. ISL-83]
MSPASVVELAQNVLIPGAQVEWQRLDLIDRWYRWSPEKLRLPAQANQEHRQLRDISETPWLTLVVTTVAQQLVAEAARSTSGRELSAFWTPWQNNRMPSRQRAIHRAALAYGYAYSTVMPGVLDAEAGTQQAAVIRGRSPRDMFAVYQDPVEDEYPMYYLQKRGSHFLVVDEEAVYTLGREDGGRLAFIEYKVHGIGVAPAIRYSNQIDLEGRTPGEVEPFIPMAKRINKTTFDRITVQHYSSWKVRTAVGLEEPKDDEEAAKRKLLLQQGDILTGGEGVQFGTLPETSPSGLIQAEERDVNTLAAVSQTPSHSLTGNMINLSADAITEARAMLDMKAGERKVGFGDSHAQTLRLAAHVEGRPDDAADFTVVIDWTDFQSRSMSQAADALGKLASQLGIPAEKLWDRIPGVTPDVASSWLKYKQENPTADAQLASALMGQASGANAGGTAAH